MEPNWEVSFFCYKWSDSTYLRLLYCFHSDSALEVSKWNMQYWLTELETKKTNEIKKKQTRILFGYVHLFTKAVDNITLHIPRKKNRSQFQMNKKNVNISNINYVRHRVLWLLLLIVPLLSSFLYCTLNYLSLMIFSDSIKTRENWTKRQLPSMRWVRAACAKRSIHKWNLCTELFCGSAQLQQPTSMNIKRLTHDIYSIRIPNSLNG